MLLIIVNEDNIIFKYPRFRNNRPMLIKNKETSFILFFLNKLKTNYSILIFTTINRILRRRYRRSTQFLP